MLKVMQTDHLWAVPDFTNPLKVCFTYLWSFYYKALFCRLCSARSKTSMQVAFAEGLALHMIHCPRSDALLLQNVNADHDADGMESS